MPWIHSPSVRQGRGSHLRTSITPGSFPSVCSHMISFPHCCWLTPTFMQMCRLAMGFERPILPSARKGFPTPASDTPLWDPSSCNPPASTTTYTHPSYSLPQSNRTQAESRNPSTKQRSHPAKGDSTVPCESHADATDLVLQGYRSDCRKGLKPRRGVPTHKVGRTTRDTLQPLLGSPALLLSPLGSVTFGPQEGKWRNRQELEGFSQAGQQREGKSTFSSMSDLPLCA